MILMQDKKNNIKNTINRFFEQADIEIDCKKRICKA